MFEYLRQTFLYKLIFICVYSLVFLDKNSFADTPVAPTPPFDLQVHSKGANQDEVIRQDLGNFVKARNALLRAQLQETEKLIAKLELPLIQDRVDLLKAEFALLKLKNEEAELAFKSAIEKAQTESILLAAARGLSQIYRKKGDLINEAIMLDALISKKPDILPFLQIRRAELMHEQGNERGSRAELLSVIEQYPTSVAKLQAEQTLTRLELGSPPSVETLSETAKIKRIRKLINQKAFVLAEKEIKQLESTKPELTRPKTPKTSESLTELENKRRTLKLLWVELYRKERDRQKLVKVLDELIQDANDPGLPDYLFQKAEAHMALDELEPAIKTFDRVRLEFPNDLRAQRSAYLAAWMLASENEIEESLVRFTSFVNNYPKAKDRDQALWFAGFTAFRANRDREAINFFEQLIKEHKTSSLTLAAKYWKARAFIRSGQPDLGEAGLKELAEIAPLTYYGLWAALRIHPDTRKPFLTVLPPETERFTPEQMIGHLGKSRPINIDRALAFTKAGAEDLAREELSAASAYFKNGKDYTRRAMIIDLLTALGAYDQAFQLASQFADHIRGLSNFDRFAFRALRQAYPNAYDKFVESAAQTHSVDAYLVLAIMRTESHFKPNALSPVGAQGLMQIMPYTARHIGKRAQGGAYHASKRKMPESNIWLGTWYLGQLLTRYQGSLALAIGAYNGGPTPMDRWARQFEGDALDEFVEKISYKETRRYIRRVLETYMIYAVLNDRPLPDLLSVLVSGQTISEVGNF